MSTDKSGNKQCGGCLSKIKDNKFLVCGGCDQYYDLACANVSETRFYNILTQEHKDGWRCALCVSKQPKGDNTNTPVRAADNGVTLTRGGGIRDPIRLESSIADQSYSTVDDSSRILDDNAHNLTVELSEVQSLVIEMRLFRAEMREELRANRTQLVLLNETLSAVTNRVLACESRIDQIDVRVSALENRVSDDSGYKAIDGSLSASIAELKMELNERDQDLLLCDVEISCIPEQRGEGLSHIVATIGSKLGVDLAIQDVVSAVRVGRSSLESTGSSEVASAEASPSRPRPIVVRLARRALRDQLLQAARVRRGATTEGLDVPGPLRRFYVNERLTRTNRQLFRRAREFGVRLGWRYVWTRDGRIFARQHHGTDAPRHRIRVEADLARVFGQEAVRSHDGH